MPETPQKLDLGGICIDCGVDTSQHGYVNRVPADRSIWKQTTDGRDEKVLEIDGYLCGTCVGDSWEEEDEDGEGYTTDWDALEKYQKEYWFPHIDEDFPDARFWREAIANEDVEAIKALVHRTQPLYLEADPVWDKEYHPDYCDEDCPDYPCGEKEN